MAQPTWSSHLKTRTVKATHTFVIEDFLFKLETPLPSNVGRYSSAKFSSPDTSAWEFQMIVTIQSKDPSQSANEKDVNLSVSLEQCPGESIPPAQPVQEQVYDESDESDDYGDYDYHNVRRWRHIPPRVAPLVPMRCKFWILGDNKPIVKGKYLQGHFQGSGSPVDCCMALDMKNILENPFTLLRQDKSLAIRCWIELNFGDEIVLGTTAPLDPDKFLHRRLTPTSFPDLNLVCEDIKLPCHKHMLVASSDVFKVMFSNDKNQESKLNQVHIQDVGPAALEKLLEYLYTDDIEEVNGLEHQLIYAADKYHMVNLKTFASNSAVNTLTADNVCDFLELGELVQSQYLTQKCLEYIYNHADEVIGSDGWKSLSLDSAKHLFEFTMKFKKL